MITFETKHHETNIPSNSRPRGRVGHSHTGVARETGATELRGESMKTIDDISMAIYGNAYNQLPDDGAKQDHAMHEFERQQHIATGTPGDWIICLTPNLVGKQFPDGSRQLAAVRLESGTADEIKFNAGVAQKLLAAIAKAKVEL